MSSDTVRNGVLMWGSVVCEVDIEVSDDKKFMVIIDCQGGV